MNTNHDPIWSKPDRGSIKIVSIFMFTAVAYAGFLIFFATSPEALESAMSSRPVPAPEDMIPELQMHSKLNSPEGPTSHKFVKSKDYRIRGEIHKIIELEKYTGKADNRVFILCKDGEMISSDSKEKIDYYWVNVEKSQIKMRSLAVGKTLEVIHSKEINSVMQSRNIRFFFAPKSAYLAKMTQKR